MTLENISADPIIAAHVAVQAARDAIHETGLFAHEAETLDDVMRVIHRQIYLSVKPSDPSQPWDC